MAIEAERPSSGLAQSDPLDEALQETFPASDPVAVGHSEHAGTPPGHASAPIEWFDDLVLGMRFRSPQMRVAAEDIKRFAAEFDPQPYHLDEEAAAQTPLKGLAPVRPGDTLHLEGELIELIPSRTKPQGIARVRWMAFNQRGEPVYSVIPLAIVPRRAA